MKPVFVEEIQHSLFDQSPFVPVLPSGGAPESFYTEGWAIIKGLATTDAAQQALERMIGGLQQSRLPLFAGLLPRLQLAKMDALPVCDDIVQTGFQALHYDMGMPFAALPEGQPLYAISALYRPVDSEPNESAKTRLVFIPDLLKQSSLGPKNQISARLDAYINAYGDGWTHPTAHNSKRLAIFARVMDAVAGKTQLSDKIDTMIGQCFTYDHSQGGEYGLQQENEFFSNLGFNLARAEQQIVLKPGEMLVFDNMRCVHGRIGQRRKRELINMIYGVKTVGETEINRYKQWLYELLAD